MWLHTSSCDSHHRCCCFTRRKRPRKGKRRKWQEPMVGDNVRYFPLTPVFGRDRSYCQPSARGAINWSFEWIRRPKSLTHSLHGWLLISTHRVSLSDNLSKWRPCSDVPIIVQICQTAIYFWGLKCDKLLL